MKFLITADFQSISGIGEVLNHLADTKYRNFFQTQNYGDSVKTLVVGLMCLDYDFLKRRLRYSRKDLAIYMDIMLDFDLFITLHTEERVEIVVQKLISEIPEAVAKYKLKEFDLDRFTADLTLWMKKALA